MCAYVLFSSWSANIGDDIQTYAVERLLGSVEGYVDRENISSESRSGILIANGWWKHRASDFPPARGIAPAYIGVHFASGDLVRGHREHFANFAPVGCRDHATLKLMQSLGVPSYLSNCLTLGLERWLDPKDGGPVLAVDVPKRCKVPPEAEKLSHDGPMSSHPRHMRDLCLSRLSQYQTASLVITGRLHVALPCIAFGTPVIFLAENPSDPRLGGVADLVPVHNTSRSIPSNGSVLSLNLRDELRNNALTHLRRAVDNAYRCKGAGAPWQNTFSSNSKSIGQSDSTSNARHPSYRIFGVGPAKSGTHSLAAMFSGSGFSSHEPDADELVAQIVNRVPGPQGDAKMRSYLLARAERARHYIDSSQLNYFILPELLELFPDSRFILTVRDCYTWLDSFINDTLRRDVTRDWKRLRDKRFRPDLYPHIKGGDDVLRTHRLYSLRGYLTYWEEHYSKVLSLVPAERLMVVKTNDLGPRAPEIADFAGLPRSSVRQEKSHSFKNPQKRAILSLLPRGYLEKEVKACCPTMNLMFPEIKTVADSALK